jgi:hypothetical protein
MKSYAKTLPGSVFSIDRRQDAIAASEAPMPSVRAGTFSATEGK